MSNHPLQLACVISQPFAENTYIAHLAGRQDCIVVDPGFDPDSIVDQLAQRSLVPAAILNTHGHSDHIAGNEALKEIWPECPLLIGSGDAPKLTDPVLNLSAPFGFELRSPPADQLVCGGQILEIAGMRLEVRDTPGHSCGHVVFVCLNGPGLVVFGGDVLFRGSVGRTDFPDGNPEQLFQSIRTQLFTLPDDTVILPGHGERTTVGWEKRTNPYVGSEDA